jgi:glycosyltransferase involved in cell wall biosynthesis
MNNISFFIPTYNSEKTIQEAVDSILETNFAAGDELIIVNDFANEETDFQLQKLKKEYPFITIINHLRNKGGAAARNTAVEHAKNELLFCLDSDNVLAPNSIKPLKAYLINQKADAASFQNQHFFLADKLKPEYTWRIPEGDVSLADHLSGKNVPGQHGNYLFTKKSWEKALGYAEGTGALDTSTFGLKQAITGAKIMVLKDSFYYHRLDYANSYWMRDAEAKIWSVSVKATYAMMPIFHLIEEKFIDYMLGKGRYSWYYNLKTKPMILANPAQKVEFYQKLHVKIRDIVYPGIGITQRVVNKIKRTIKK